MWFYGIDQNDNPVIEFVPLQRSAKTNFKQVGGCVSSEERAKLLLRKLIREQEKKCSTSR